MNLAEFVKTNLVSGYQNGSFTTEQVNIFALNYQLRGIITEGDFNEIIEAITPQESE